MLTYFYYEEYSTNVSLARFDYLQTLWWRYISSRELKSSRKSFENYTCQRLENHEFLNLKKELLPVGHIRRSKAISNSSLSRLRDKLLGKEPRYPNKAYVLGSAFHEAVLENNFDLKDFCLSPSVAKHILKLAKSMLLYLHNSNFPTDPSTSRREKTLYWNYNGFDLKGKIDFLTFYKGRVAIELKTTRAATKADFLRDFENYDYDRQCAFYRTHPEIDKIIILAISKENGQIYFHKPTKAQLETGQKKMDFLLKKYKQHKILVSTS